MKSRFALLAILVLTPLSLPAQSYPKQPDKPVDLVHDKNLYLAGYAHLDTQWRWTYVDTIESYVRNTMEQNFALFDKYPNYVFNFTGSRRYEFMKEYYPESYERVKHYVKAGRWVPAGSSVDEGDANIPSLESMTRHLLYGNHFFQHEFGTQGDDFLLPDCFGFPASLPTVLAHGGIKGFSTQKLTWGSAVGIPFNFGVWYGPDGSSIMATLNPGGYGNQITEDLSKNEMWLKRINEDGAQTGVFADYKYFGIGDRGGAAKDSTVEWVEKALVSGGPVRILSSRSDRIFNDVTPAQIAKLPTYKGELMLVNHSDGALNSEAYMKRWNRKNEQLAAAAEGAAAAASWLGAFPYPYDPLYQGWDLVLGSQMHDIMPGTSVPKAYEYSWNDEVLALNEFASVTEHATAAVLAQLDTSAKGTPVAVYNPLATDREDPVEASVPFSGEAPKSIVAYDPQGQPVPTQILDRQGMTLRVLFLAKVPSVGYAVYDLRPEQAAPAKSVLAVGANSLENTRYRVGLNAAGDIASVFDKSLNRELLSAPTSLSLHTENPFAYPAWNMNYEDRILPARAVVGGPAKIRVLEDGPARVALAVERQCENSTFVQEIRLAAGGAADRLEIVNHIDWRALGVSLRAAFPLAATNAEATFDDKAGAIRRGTNDPKHFELAQQQWMDLTDKDGAFGVSILNDCKYGSDKPDDHTLRTTMIFTPGVRDRYPDQATQDIGRHEIAVAFAAHKGSWEDGRTSWQAARFNQPLRAFLPAAHPGAFGRIFSLVSLNTGQVQIAAVKQAEDSTEIVVRLKELTGKPAGSVSVRFAAPVTAAREIDGQERPVGGNVTVRGGALACEMKAFGLRAFAVKLARPAAPAAPVASQPVLLAYDTDVASSRANRTDGAMSANGAAYPAEMFPRKVSRAGVDFQLGATTDGAKNAVAAHGQTLALPAGNFTRIHLLAAGDGDASGQIKIGGASQPFDVPNWTGYIGQWDNRLWSPADPDVDHKSAPVGLAPGYIKRTPVAWFATHHNAPQGDAIYEYSYLFELSYDLPAGTTSVTLPDNPKIRVFAASVGREAAAAPAAAPLYDTLADHQAGGAPGIAQAGQTYNDATPVTLVPPLYHQANDLHYTLDGSEPTASSPVYDGPFTVADTVNIAARQIDAGGRLGAITRGTVNVHDTTRPKVVDVRTDKNNALAVTFSEPLNPATATDANNYAFQPALTAGKISPTADRRGVTIAFANPLASGAAYTVSLRGIKDTAPAGNALDPVKLSFNADNVVYALAAAELPGGAVAAAPVAGLPVLRREPWTMNLLVKTDAKPKDRVLLAGFGKAADEQDGGPRYLAVFPEDIEFWTGGKNLKTNSPLDLGRWQMLTVAYTGDSVTVYKDGQRIGNVRVGFATDSDASVSVGGLDPWKHQNAFAGSVRDFTIRRGALNDGEVKKLYERTKIQP